MNRSDYVAELKLFRKRGVPIVIISGCLDQQHTRDILSEKVFDKDVAVFEWDFARGLQLGFIGDKALKEKAESELARLRDEGNYLMSSIDAIEAIDTIIKKMSGNCTFIFSMADRILNPYNDSMFAFIQFINHLRDRLKGSRSSLYLIGQQFDVPRELKENVVILEEPLLDEEERFELVSSAVEAYQDKAKNPIEYDDKAKTELADSLRGGSKFGGEQSLFLSMDATKGLELAKVREKKRQTINKTVGLEVLNSIGGFDALGGLGNLKEYYNKLQDGRMNTSVIVQVDEVEKMLGGAVGGGADTSGVSQSFLGTFLTKFQETNSLGLMFTGVYGCGKSAFTKAMVDETNALGIEMNMNKMKGSLVGESEANFNNAMQVIYNLAGESPVLYVVTCNRPESLPPEFKSRFNLGTFFFCYPTQEERDVIWDIYMKRYGLENDKISFNDYRWTGREIEACCRNAYMMKCTLDEASNYITPIYLTAQKETDTLMVEAHRRYLSTTHSGMFDKNKWEEEEGEQPEVMTEREFTI